jgi:hypothetical protein
MCVIINPAPLTGCGKAQFALKSYCDLRNGAGARRLAGCSKWPSSAAAASEEARRTLRYVEPLSDARTKLADFFSILLKNLYQGDTT